MRKRILALAAALFLFALPAQAAEEGVTSLAQLEAPGIVVGVSQGSAAERTVQEALPLAQRMYFTDNPSAYLAVAQGKVDAFVFDYNQMRIAIENGVAGVRLLDETLGEPVRVAVGISPAAKIPDLEGKLNRFIAEARADGTLDDMYRRWVLEDNPVMPEIPEPENPALRLTVGTSGIVPPFSYYEGTELTGYDVELARRFAAWLGAEAQLKVYDYGAIIAAAASGSVDCVMANLNITPERREALTFSDILYEEKLGVMVRSEAPPVIGPDGQAGGAFTSLSQMKNARIGVQTGTSHYDIVRACLPDAEISFFNTYPDLAAALEANKIDGFPGDDIVLKLMAAEDPKLAVLEERMESMEAGFVLPKTEAGDALRAQLNAWLAKIRESGELEALLRKWTELPEAEKTVPDYAAFPAPNGTLILATEGAFFPMNYFREGEVVGMEIDLTARFCEAHGYGLRVEAMNFDGILPAIQAGKADFAAAGVSITDERKESVNFSDPYYVGGTVMAVLKAEEPAAASVSDASRGQSFRDGVVSSFGKTFLRENRWQLFLEGVGTTTLITLLSILFGTILGFLLFLPCRNGNRAANAVTGFALWLVQGTPMVVLLMILYYIVFGSVAVSGVTVAVIGFTLTFGASVFGLLRMGVGAVDRGQYEAAYALGHGSRRTFFKIILPQAVPHVLPSYQGEIVSLIKVTAIVGYIAVQDLTKMGDIVRSRTYEAFFPLIAVTVIYFALEGLFGFAVSRVRIRIDPRRRSRKRILKGVKTHD